MATGNSFDGQKSVKGSEEDFHIVCLPCHRDGETMAAYGYCCQCKEHLCASCFKYHKRSTPTRHHRLLDKDEMPDTQELDKSIHAASSDNLTSPCPRHKNEMLKLYCHDHKMLLCHICVAIEHTKQCQVAYIPDFSNQIIDSKEYENVIERMDKVLTECASIKDKTSEDAENSNISMNEGLEDIRRLRQKIIDKLDKMLEDIENKNQALKQQNEDRLEEDESICNDVIKKMTIVSDSLNQLNASKQADSLFVELKQSLIQLQEYEDIIRLLSTKSPIKTYKFVPSSMLSAMLLSEESWDDLTAVKQQYASSSDQQEYQAKDQTKQTIIQSQVVNSSTQQQQRANTTDQHPEQARDQTKPNNCQDQVVSTPEQQQKQQQWAYTSDQQQDRDQTKPKSDITQTTMTFDLHHKGKTEALTTPTSQQAQPTNYHIQAASTSTQQQDKTRDQVKPNNNGTMAASFSDQQQQDKTEAQTTPTPQDAQHSTCQALAANTSSQQKDQTKPKNNGKQGASSSEQQQQQGKTEVQPTPTSQQAKQMHAPSHNQVGYEVKQTSQQSQAYHYSNQKQDLVRAKSHSTSAQYNPILRPAYDNIKPTRHGEMYIKTSEDGWMSCDITGMTTLPSGKLVLVDHHNNAVKLVDINKNKIISRLAVKSPWDITAISSTQVAVTVPAEKEIRFITVTDKLSLKHKVKTNGECYGICCNENNIVVTCNNPGKLEIMNMKGGVMASVQKDSTGEDIFSKPNYVQANSNYIYVSDNGKKQVIKLNWQGEVTGRIGGLDIPEGLTLLHDGSLLVCDWSGHTVYHVSGDCANKRAVLQGVSYPRAICVDDGGHALYISRWNVLYNTDDDNNILVYKL